MKYLKIDSEGFYIDVAELEQDPKSPEWVNAECTKSFVRTKWRGEWDTHRKQWKPGGKWVEGASQEEIETLRKQVPGMGRNWEALAIAFHSSALYNIHFREVTAKAPSEWSDKLWWCDKDLTIVFTAWLGDEVSRFTRLKEVLIQLIEILNGSGFPISADDKNQITQALNQYGFQEISTIFNS
jgi:hypothetical protein